MQSLKATIGVAGVESFAQGATVSTLRGYMRWQSTGFMKMHGDGSGFAVSAKGKNLPGKHRFIALRELLRFLGIYRRRSARL